MIFFIPTATNVKNPLNKHKKPIGIKKKFSCKIPCASIYSTDTAFRKMQAIPMHNNMPPIDIEIKLIFARFVSLPDTN